MLRRPTGLTRERGQLIALVNRPALLAVCCSVLVLWSGTPSLLAQEHEREHPAHGPPILGLSTSARALALGNAFWLGGNGGHAIFHHPALISGQGLDISAGTAFSRHRDRGDSHEHDREHDGHRDPDGNDSGHRRDDALFMALSGSGAWLGGTVAAGLAVYDYGAGHGRDERGERGPAAGYRSATGDGWSGATEFVGTLGYAREMFGFGVGAAAKVVGWNTGDVRARTAAADLGLAREIGRIALALSVQNLGPGMKLGGDPVPLPRRVVLGAGTRRRAPVGPLDIGGAVQVAREHGGEIVPGGGVEIAYWPIQRRVFIVRLGAVRVAEGEGLPLTFGAGFEGDRIRVDYGYSDRDALAGAHRFGISIR